MKTPFQFVTALLVISNISFGQDVTKKIDSIIKDNYQKNPTVGISVGFIQNNNEHYVSYGKLNNDSSKKIDKNSLFEIASITKILTSNLIAQAAVENKLKIDDYIDSYLPKAYQLHPNLTHKIKISDLASHQSGLPDVDFKQLIERNPQQPISAFTEEALISMINNCTALTDYGKYRYSTVGYTLLGQILEKIYNKPYATIIREKMIAPLRMTHTLTTDFNVKNRTTGHNPDGGIQEFFEWNVTAPAGLVKSTASDMVAYLKAVLNDKTAIGKAALLTEKTTYKDQNREMGLGTNIITDDKNTIYLKSGDSMGQSSILFYNRAKNWGVILLLDYRNSKMRQELLNKISEAVQ
ncbi:serine hydrolase domain-containing protein [Flavobacterium cerinum]|uniref:Beta-lactamase family protein n=1 Tax=Flavobacterium cerinum TaxID=2502784 RepID=A0ABY5IVN3_9FLAO|nr:serine hydrolase domain-containing protein [Flavobacterium cerinum]UUC46883.1 beta-lactamase family protein [Flavobacterium cerinum]